MPALAILYDARPTSSVPLKRIEPDVFPGGIWRIALQSVVLPMPLRPMSETGSSRTSKDTSCRTCAGP